MLTTRQAAERLGLCEQRVRALIAAGRVKSEKLGHVHMIQEKDLAAVAIRKPGRPPRPIPETPPRDCS